MIATLAMFELCLLFYHEGHVLPGDGTVELHTLPGMEELEGGDEMKQQDPKEKMTYTEQAAKRILCHRLTR